MKIYIVTVYNSLNAGSFLQAAALYKAVEQMGLQVAFLDAGTRNLRKITLTSALSLVKKLDFMSAISKISMGMAFDRELRNFQIVKLDSSIMEDKKAYFILGSDEIWNVSRKDMADYPIFWGKGLPLERCISYAPSINNATCQDLMNHAFVSDGLKNIGSISVRDHYSYECLKRLTKREITEVCDPTLLLPYSEYIKAVQNIPMDDYILIYMYPGAIDENKIKAVKEFSRMKQLKTVCFGSYLPWCDEFAGGSPYDFLAYMEKADYVCTTTFHGTMFSAIFQKKFAVLGEKNRKVLELLDTLQLNRHANENNLMEICDMDYDHVALHQRINELRKKGINFLSSNLGNA